MGQTMSLLVYGSALGKTSERFVVKKEGKVIEEKPFFRVSEIVVPSRGVTVSASAIYEAVARGIRISFLGPTGTPYAMLSSSALVATVETRRQQLAALDDWRGLEFARSVVVGKIKNQARLLKYFDKYESEAEPALSARLKEIVAQLEAQAGAAEEVDGARVADVRFSLLGVEGGAARVYWRGVAALLEGAAPFEGRSGRGAADPVNALLNYGYGVLSQAVWGAVLNAGLEPYAGFLHVDRPGKPSLVLDLMEEFRAPVVDRPVLALCRRGEPVRIESGKLDRDTRRLVAERVLEKLGAEARFGGRRVSVRAIVQAQVRSLASFLRGQGSYRPFAFQW
jgi:CRISPR-associated protein Cas1